MNRTWLSEVKLQESIKVSGWIHRIKKLKKVVFIVLRDRSGLMQLALSPESFGQLKLESVITVTGKVVEQANKYGPYEIQVHTIEVLSQVTEDLPIKINEPKLVDNLETLLNNRVLGLRHHQEQSVLKVKNAIVQAFRAYLESNHYTEIQSPKLVKEGAEGGSNVFSLDYFGQEAFLAQSPQFYKQMMVIAGCERVFEIGPVFRAESHSTSRHLNEYTSMDLEVGFIKSEFELMTLETNLLKYIFKYIEATYKQALNALEIVLPELPEEIPYLTLEDAITILNENYGKELVGDLDPEGELLIGEYIKNKTGSDFVFLTDYSQQKRPMYTMPKGETGTRSFDLLFKGLEITTGGLRIHNKEALIESMIKKGLNPSEYSTYLEAFTYGAPPHGGLAIGLERLTAQILGFSNIRRTTLFPRDRTRLTP